ncbi:aspartyl protease family protein At5g10770-like [Diospyros lotus]|uniref:aspartyl protease family protein At5g10770-like n=1 Tax=Diospyros lotus TaxID=55363 RepID=UPI0022575A6E|nr:aspartyl protease family protein At5g10770-like [Diospyros lotus]
MATASTATPLSSNSHRRLLLLSLLFILCFSSDKGYALRAGGEEEALQTHHHTVPLSSLLPASTCTPSTQGKKGKASVKVVHWHGPCSTLKQKEATAPTPAQILSHDQSRVKSIQSQVNSGRSKIDYSQAATLPAKSGSSIGSPNYIVTVGLGTPKKDFSLVFDTGSDLTWIQCQPCAGSCYKQKDPIFDPSLSKSYKNVTCDSSQCSLLTSATGNEPICSISTCIYDIHYGDRSFSMGYFASETLTLTPTDVFPGFLFGCGENNRGLFNGAAGLLGLGRDKLSLISQTESKYGKYFSYCLPSTSSGTGHLTFGKGGISGNPKFTTLSINPQGPSFYFITIIAIKVGGKILPISQSVFTTAGTIIDSGTVITRLPPGAYTPLKTAFRQQMTKYPLTDPVSILDTCYDLSNYTTVTVPIINFYFAGNTEVPLDLSGILYFASPSQVCLAFAGNGDASDLGIFGNVQQRTLDVVYDVAGGKLGFGPGGCS